MRPAKEDTRHYPMFRHRSATLAGVAGNGEVRSLGGQRSLDLTIGRERASRLGDRQYHRGREPADRDMVNLLEVPIKVVTIDKPKMLIGLNQNGTWSGTGSCHISRRGRRTTGRQARPKSRMILKMNEITPLSPRQGRRTVKNADEAAAEG